MTTDSTESTTASEASPSAVCESADELRAFFRSVEHDDIITFERPMERVHEHCEEIIDGNEHGYAPEMLPEMLVSEMDDIIEHYQAMRDAVAAKYAVVWPPEH